MPLARYLVDWTIGWSFASMRAWKFRSMILIPRLVVARSIFGCMDDWIVVRLEACFDTFACFDASLECSLAAILSRLDNWMFGRLNARLDTFTRFDAACLYAR
jgi:hypothetical protein